MRRSPTRIAASRLLDRSDDSSFAASEIRWICSRAAAFDATPDDGALDNAWTCSIRRLAGARIWRA